MPRSDLAARRGSKGLVAKPKNHVQQEKELTDSRGPESFTSSGETALPNAGSKTTKSPTKKTVRSLSKGGLTATEALELSRGLAETERKKYDKKEKPKKDKTRASKRKESENPVDDTKTDDDIVLPPQPDLPAPEMSNDEIEKENRILQKAEQKLAELKVKAEEKEIIFNKLLLELKRMIYIFNKAKEVDILTVCKEITEEPKEKRLTIEQKKELLDKGPFNLIFHGVVPDWIEAEMDDDPDFMKDVLGQRMKNMIKDECGIARDVGIVDCYRYYDGQPYNEAYPVIVEFKARREKEQLLWRSKDKLRKIDIIVTDDIALRQKMSEDENYDPRQTTPKAMIPESPKKKQKYKPSVEEELFGDFF